MSERIPIDWLPREKWQSGIRFDEFQEVLEKSKKDCPELIKIKEQIFLLGSAFAYFQENPSFFNEDRLISDRYSQQLFFTCFLESFRSIYSTLFLTANGLYRNAYHNIRYALELMILSEHFDKFHPNDDFMKKLTMFRKEENREELRMRGLLKEIDHACKGEIIREWKKLSRKVHPSYMQIVNTMVDFQNSAYRVVYLEPREVSSIYESMKNVCHFYLVSIFTYFPEFKISLREKRDFVNTLKDHNQRLALRMLWSE